MEKGKDLKSPLERVKAENTNRAKKNYERKLKRLKNKKKPKK